MQGAGAKVLEDEDIIQEVLRQLGITRAYRGYGYLVCAVKLAMAGAAMDQLFYKRVAETCGENRQRVYANINRCIQRSWQRQPVFLSKVMERPVEDYVPSVYLFVQALAKWVRRYEARFVFCEGSSFGRILWSERTMP